jgi:hypothetical protein
MYGSFSAQFWSYLLNDSENTVLDSNISPIQNETHTDDKHKLLSLHVSHFVCQINGWIIQCMRNKGIIKHKVVRMKWPEDKYSITRRGNNVQIQIYVGLSQFFITISYSCRTEYFLNKPGRWHADVASHSSKFPVMSCFWQSACLFTHQEALCVGNISYFSPSPM